MSYVVRILYILVIMRTLLLVLGTNFATHLFPGMMHHLLSTCALNKFHHRYYTHRILCADIIYGNMVGQKLK